MAQKKTARGSRGRAPKSRAAAPAVKPTAAKGAIKKTVRTKTKTSAAKARKAKPQKTAEPPSEEKISHVGFTKRFLKSRPSCRVTFRLPAQAAQGARKVSVVGDFNGWDNGATVMKRLKGGSFTTTVELPCGQDYRFRYVIDGIRWENDWKADKYISNVFGSDDSVVTV